ncbi:protein adenylyltransferase SelO [Legionella gresilensis]|uniref:protein adenylyltransferase SelO n=1 Tax=Legionella gresilensis TaxID=91823 RepID=UPI00104154F4|nr:YdiU family protein [Legionella gresilensis]
MKLNFDNSFARLTDYFFTKLAPVPVKKPSLVHISYNTAELLGIKKKDIEKKDFADYFAGNRLLQGSEPLASVYSGHQFGYYVPQLGDGRALLLGEVVNQRGEHWDIQLKGSGQTPYSRMGDGRAVLRSTIREYLCSGAMHALNIPTTQALCIVETDEPVYREIPEPGAILTRVAESLIRFGHFEYFYYTSQHQALKELANYVLARHYPDAPANSEGYLHLFSEAVLKTARLIAQWQAVGFCHGVMNTDNMSILGLTIDYGPFGFLNAFNNNHICNSSDYTGRYAYGQQPAIGFWNLLAFAQALTPLVTVSNLQDAIAQFDTEFQTYYSHLLHEKFGLEQRQNTDKQLIADLFHLLEQNQVDHTLFFRRLSSYDSKNDILSYLFKDKEKFNAWLERYNSRLTMETLPLVHRHQKMKQINPKFILRNHLAQQAITDAYENKNYNEIDRLYTILQKPFDEQPEYELYSLPPPKDLAEISVSCSS